MPADCIAIDVTEDTQTDRALVLDVFASLRLLGIGLTLAAGVEDLQLSSTFAGSDAMHSRGGLCASKLVQQTSNTSLIEVGPERSAGAAR